MVRFNLALERHAGKIYTRAMYEQFGEILFQALAFRVEEIEKNAKYKVVHTESHRIEKWCRVEYQVDVNANGSEFECECGLFDHMGMLCCHALKVDYSIHIQLLLFSEN